jgi:dTDP-4-amino-4,6-dideoxygalactose transaminase
MLLTDDTAAAFKARKWSTQSRECAPWYQHKEIGYNYRMSNIIAGVIRGQMPYMEDHIARKKAIYERYKAGFAGLPITMNPYDPDTMEPNFWLSCMLIDRTAMCEQNRGDIGTCYATENGKTCPDEIFETLERYNVQSRPIWKPMHMQPVFAEYDFIKAEEYSVSEDIFARGLCLPSDIKMTEEEQNTIIHMIRSCFE